jgi:hypothetical protein
MAQISKALPRPPHASELAKRLGVRSSSTALPHATGGADGGVEGGVGVAEAVGAGGFEGAIEFAQGPAVGGRDLAVGAPKVSRVTLARHWLRRRRWPGRHLPNLAAGFC